MKTSWKVKKLIFKSCVRLCQMCSRLWPLQQSEHQTARLLWSLHSHMTGHFLWHAVKHPVQNQHHFLSLQPYILLQLSSAHWTKALHDVSSKHDVHWKHTNTLISNIHTYAHVLCVQIRLLVSYFIFSFYSADFQQFVKIIKNLSWRNNIFLFQVEELKLF